MYVVCIVLVVGAFLVGLFLGKTIIKSDGMMIVDDSDDETTRWILDVSIDPNSIPNRKSIHLKIRKMAEGDV